MLTEHTALLLRAPASTPALWGPLMPKEPGAGQKKDGQAQGLQGGRMGRCIWRPILQAWTLPAPLPLELPLQGGPAGWPPEATNSHTAHRGWDEGMDPATGDQLWLCLRRWAGGLPTQC